MRLKLRRPAKPPAAYAPSAITTGNMFLGFLSIVSAFNEQYLMAAWLITIGGFLDVFDGKVARLSGHQSKFGGELDSLADLITFGLAPVMLMYEPVLHQYGKVGLVIGFFFLMSGAFRLARFNLMPPKKEKGSFTGMPIPMAAGIVSTFIPFTNEVYGEPGFYMSILIVCLMLVTSILMISTIPYACFPKFAWQTTSERIRTCSLIVFFVSLAIYPAYVFFPAGVLYLLSGLVGAMLRGPQHPSISEEMKEANV